MTPPDGMSSASWTCSEVHCDTAFHPAYQRSRHRPNSQHPAHFTEGENPLTQNQVHLRGDCYLEEAPSVEALTCDLPVMDISIFEIHGGVTDERHGLRS